MFDFGDDIIDNYRIPWLIWIQILVMFLLTITILLSYFGLFVLDSSSSTSNILSFTTSSPSLETSSRYSRRTQEAGNHNARAREEVAAITNNSETDGSSAKDLAPASVVKRFYHPCRYLDFARQAFLKCLGLGSGSENSPSKEHEHED